MRLPAIALAIALSGCANSPEAPGVNIVTFSTADTVKVQWDDWLSSEDRARQKAQAHCGDRTLQEIDASVGPAMYMGLWHSKTWRCVSPSK